MAPTMSMGPFSLLVIACFGGMVSLAVSAEVLPEDSPIPVFTLEPGGTQVFSNSSGKKIDCLATSNSETNITWRLADGSPMSSGGKIRHVTREGSLVFPPFRAEDFRQDVHSVSYRCAASNAVGTVVSRSVGVRAVVLQPVDLHVYNVYTIRGNSVVIRCHIPEIYSKYMTVRAWIRDAVVTIVTSKFNEDAKYWVLPTGDLFVRNVESKDMKSTFRCQATNQLNGETKTSSSAGRIIVTESQGTVPPKIILSRSEVAVASGQSVFLPCVAQGNPVPTSSWMKRSAAGQLNPVKLTARCFNVSGSLIIQNIRPSDAGFYSCVATNNVGRDTAETLIKVTENLGVSLEPHELKVDLGDSAQITCKPTGSPITSITWKKDGRPVENALRKSNETIFIEKMSHSIAGIYQCFVANEFEEIHGLAVVKVGDEKPSLINVFEEKTLQQGESIKITCSAKGNPQPVITWTLDNMPLPKTERIKAESVASKAITYQVYIRNARPEDGGLYKCTAENKAGKAEHWARINVIGPVAVRPNVKYFTTAEENLYVNCPVYGYPIGSISWFKDKITLPTNIRQIPFKNGTMLIQSVRRQVDSGLYSCSVPTKRGQTLVANVEVVVMVKPKITPFSFQHDLIREGARARLTCVVSEGEAPIELSWVKDGGPIPEALGVVIRSLDEFSSILMISAITPRHNGNYTCRASNAAGQTSYTAVLFVNVPPKVVPFTFQDEHLLEGMLVRVSCVVSRGDLPLTISWLKDGQALTDNPPVTVRDFDEYSSVLSIDPITARHSGNYTCVAKNQAGQASHTASLSVYVPPHWVIKPNDTVAKTGKNLFINCQADGFPKPVISWNKAVGDDFAQGSIPISNDERKRVFNNGTLFIPDVTKEDQGYYYCVATHETVDSLSAAIFVKIKAAPYFQEHHIKVFAIKGEEVTLECAADGDWPISYSWFGKNGIINVETSNQRYKVQSIVDKEKETGRSLFLMSWIGRKDSTTYKCMAENALGSDEISFELIVQEPPESPSIDEPLTVINQSVLMAWNTPYEGNSPITRYIVQYKTDGEKWSELNSISVSSDATSTTISDLNAATLYNLRIMAENSIGNSTFSEIMQVRTEDAAPGGPPENVEVESIDKSTLRVIWRPPQKILWNGVIQGYRIGHKVRNSSEPWLFSSLEVPEDYGDDLIYQLTNLALYTQYTIIVQAYNSKGPGPSSEETHAMTSEDVPSSPPVDIRCSALSSTSIYSLWEPPNSSTVNGILRGYKVFYKPVEEWYDSVVKSKVVNISKATLLNLEANTNYTIQVLAFTRVGDGTKSNPIFCKTHEDIPEPPVAIKVLPSSSESVVIAWKPPKKSKGAVTKYNVYYKPIEEGQQVDFKTQNTEQLSRDAVIHSAQSDNQFMEINGLKKDRKYAFWVTATSVIGESSTSPVVAQTVAESTVAAKSASFDDTIDTPWKKDIVMQCKAVGVPSPIRKWRVGNKPIKITEGRVKLRTDGALLISSINSEDTGNYTCAIYNEHGKDEVKYAVTVQVPPAAPTLSLISKSRTSIQLQWKAGPDGGDPIRGYLLHYKRDHGSWATKELRPDLGHYTLESLACGSIYQVYMEAFNKIGTGLPCDIITIATDGADLKSPLKEDLIREGATFVTVHLDAWPSSGCPVHHFTADYRSINGQEWKIAGSKVKPSQRKLVISGLDPATWYILRLTAETSGDATVLEYRFATHTPAGGTIAPHSTDESLLGLPVYGFYLDPIIFIPAVALFIVVIITSVVVCLYFRKRGTGSVGSPSEYSEPVNPSWIRTSRSASSGAVPTNRHTLPRRGTDPSPYATAHLPDCYPDGRPTSTGHQGFPLLNGRGSSDSFCPTSANALCSPPVRGGHRDHIQRMSRPEWDSQATTFFFPPAGNQPGMATPMKKKPA